MPLDFTAIDFETANGSPASPCAVGLVRVRDGVLVEGMALLFKPPYPHNWFHEGNIRVHGIHPSDVEDALEYDAALPAMLEFIGTDVLIAHNAPFDRRYRGAPARAQLHVLACDGAQDLQP